MNVYVFSDDADRREDDTDVEPGVNVMFGVQHRQGFVVELKVVAIDSPDVRFAVGYAWR